MSGEEDVVRAKENLQNALGERFNDYMQSMRKWFSGKSTKQEFDREAREIVTERYVHLHNEFLLCIITKCNNFSSTASEAASTTILPLMSATQPSTLVPKTPPSSGGNKRKLTPTPPPPFLTSVTSPLSSSSSSSNTPAAKYNHRFIPVDPIKHAPTIQTASLYSAAMASRSDEFAIEFCARERTLPYARMIHSRMLLGALDHNLSPQVDMQAVFLLAEATLVLLKNIVSKLASRSQTKQALVARSLYEDYVRQANINDERILASHARRMNKPERHFDIDEKFIKSLRRATGVSQSMDDMDIEDNDHRMDHLNEEELDTDQKNERVELKSILDQYNYASTVPVRKLPTNLFDLKSLLQCHRKLIPSHSIRTVSMEKIMCNMWHDDHDQDN